MDGSMDWWDGWIDGLQVITLKWELCTYNNVRYCSECKTDTSEVIGAGEKMRLTKKKANMVSKRNETGNGRDWGKVSNKCYDNCNDPL